MENVITSNITVKSVFDLINSLQYIFNPFGQNKLSVNIVVIAKEPVKYTYTISGITEDVDFTYGVDVFAQEFTIPVIGLYANRVSAFTVTFENQSGRQEQLTRGLSTASLDFSDVLTHIDFEIANQGVADATLGNGWLFTNFNNAYDKNGDLRLTGLYPWKTTSMKTYQNSYYVGDSLTGEYYAKKIHQVSLLGEIRQTFVAPEGHGFHHDITFDNNGNIFIHGTLLSGQTAANRLESIIYKYSLETGDLLWQRDYSSWFDEQDVLISAYPNDVHFNSIEYIENLNLIIANTRSSCSIIGLDAVTGDFRWVIDNPANTVLGEPNLNVITEGYVYQNGQHSVFNTTNPKYSNYFGEDRLAITVFNNKANMYEDGTDMLKKMEDPRPDTWDNYLFDSQIYILGLDFAVGTAELLDVFTVPGERSEYASSVFQNGDYYELYYGDSTKYFIVDTNNNVAVSCHLTEPLDAYRGRIFNYDEIKRLI